MKPFTPTKTRREATAGGRVSGGEWTPAPVSRLPQSPRMTQATRSPATLKLPTSVANKPQGRHEVSPDVSPRQSPRADQNKRVALQSPRTRATTQTSLFDQQLKSVLMTLNAPKNLKQLGLHRVPGEKENINDAVRQFKSGQVANPAKPEDASGLLKQLFELPYVDGQTLIPEPLQDGMFRIYLHDKQHKRLVKEGKRIKDERELKPIGLAEQLANECMRNLPSSHKKAFLEILTHLTLVAKHSASNKMDAANLAIVFGTKLYSGLKVSDPSELRDYSAICVEAMKILIERAS